MAFTLFFKAISPLMQGQAHKIVKQADAVREVVQEAFIKIWLNRDRLPAIEFLPAYVKKIVLNECFTYLNKQLLLKKRYATTENDLTATIADNNTENELAYKETSVSPGNMADTRASMSVNVNTMSEDRKFNLTFSGSYSADNNALTNIDLANALTLPPNLRLYDSAGNYAWNEAGITTKDNPLASLLLQKYKANTTNLLANMVLSYKILKNLTIRSSFGYNSMQVDESKKLPIAAQNPSKSTNTGGAQFGNNNLKSYIIEPQVEYIRNIGRGRLTLLGGGTFNQVVNKSTTIIATGYTSDEFLGSLSGAGNINATVNYYEYKYNAFFGRATYNWDNRYIVNLSGRRDGSSRFGPDFRFSNFGSVGAAWLFGNEAFMASQSVISFGKLRASYGSTGNDKISDYQYLDSWKATTNTYGDSSTLYPTKLYNPLLHWEKNTKLEVALELGFLKDRLFTSLSYYRNRSSDPLVSYPLSYSTGFSSAVANLNDVLVVNEGLEVVINSTNIKTNTLEWNTSLNFTIPKNKLARFPNLQSSSYATSFIVGESLNLIYAPKSTGVDPQTGLYAVKDVNNDGKSGPADYFVSGNRDRRFYGGLQNGFRYKGFELNFLFQFVMQKGSNWKTNTVYNQPGALAYNQPSLVLGRWQKPGDITDIQQYTLSQGSLTGTSGYYSMMFSDGRYSDASFVRLKNLSVSYNLPARWMNHLAKGSCRLYVLAQNLLTFTRYKGGDPETQNFLVMPILRTITGGIQFNL